MVSPISVATIPAGAGLTVAGIGLNALGQHQGLRAMQDAWGRDQAIQNAYSAKLGQAQDTYLNQVNPQTIFNPQYAVQQQNTTNRDAANTFNAVGPGRGGAEGAAAAAQANGGTLARVQHQGHIAAFLQALQQGRITLDQLGRQYAIDANHIRGDAAQWGNLAQQHQQTASMKGAGYRQLGTLAGIAGQGLMNFGMSQPAQSPSFATPNAGVAGNAGAADLMSSPMNEPGGVPYYAQPQGVAGYSYPTSILS